jgi:hypothetical protein
MDERALLDRPGARIGRLERFHDRALAAGLAVPLLALERDFDASTSGSTGSRRRWRGRSAGLDRAPAAPATPAPGGTRRQRLRPVAPSPAWSSARVGTAKT